MGVFTTDVEQYRGDDHGRSRDVSPCLGDFPARRGRAVVPDEWTHDEGQPASWSAMLHQAEWWRPRTGIWVRLEHMADTYRLNAAGWLLDHATAIGYRLVLNTHRNTEALTVASREELDQLIHEVASIEGDPLGWMRRRPLFGALLDGLPMPPTSDWPELMARVAHWSTCPRSHHLGVTTPCTCGSAEMLTDGTDYRALWLAWVRDEGQPLVHRFGAS